MRKFADKQTKNKEQTDRQTVQRLRPLYPLWILEGVGQLQRRPYYKRGGEEKKNEKICLQASTEQRTIKQTVQTLRPL